MSRIDILTAALFTPTSRGWGLPIIVWGPPGVAKTDTILHIGKRFGLHVEPLSPGERGEGAFGVTPVPVERAVHVPGQDGLQKYLVLEYPRPDWTETLLSDASEPAGVVFVDETNTAPRGLQPALLGLIHEKRIGSHYLGKRVRILGAANPPEMSAGGTDLPVPVANRLGHLDWLGTENRPDAIDWCAWLLGSNVDRGDVEVSDAKKREDEILKAWPKQWAMARALVAGYIRANPDALFNMPKSGDPKATRAWPSPRSWENATRALAGGEVNGLDSDSAEEFVGCFVGQGAASELFEFQDKADLPDPERVLDQKVKFAHDPDRIDRTEVTLNACASFLENRKVERRVERATVLWGILDEVAGDLADLCLRPMATLINSDLSKIPEARPVLARMQPFTHAAGIVPAAARRR